MHEQIAAGLVDSDAELAELVHRLRGVDRLGIDTEFVGERTYIPQLELIQVAFAGKTAVIDCRAVHKLDGLLAVLLDRRVEKILHAGQQDLDLLFGLAGDVPAPVFDTQVAAAMVGYGAQPGYAALVERLLRARLSKSETLTDWSRRPLSARQVAYAHDDVRHLLPLREHLGKRLAHLGREEWLREELRRFEDPESYRRPVPAESYLRVRGRGALSARCLVVLRELAAWREEEAQRRNKPRASILGDEILVDLSRRAPTDGETLRNFRGQFARAVGRYEREILAAVQRALATPRDAWPAPPAHQSGPQPGSGVLELMQAALRLCADAAQIAPTMVATNADLHALVESHLAGEAVDLPVLRGWRNQIAGQRLLALLRGEIALRVDARKQRAVIEE